MAKDSRAATWDDEAPSPGQLKELFTQVENRKITSQRLQRFLDVKKDEPIIEDEIEKLEAFYARRFGLNVDLANNVTIPPWRKGFNRLIIIAHEVTANFALDTCRQHFPCETHTDDLDAAITHNDRSTDRGPYAFWVRDGREADHQWRNVSADALEEKGIRGETLTEQLVHELMYFDETGEHLDVKSATLCSGSRNSGGYVPIVYGYDGKLCVYWYCPSFAYGSLRAREVVA